MTPEERLRELLQEEAEQVLPAYDALPLLRERVGERRSWRRRLQPLLAATAGLAVVVAGTLATSATDRSSVDRSSVDRAVERPRPEPTVEPSECAVQGDVLCAEDAPLPEVPMTSGITTSGDATPFWPFTDDREAAAWVRDAGARTWAADPQQVAQRLVEELLGLSGVTAGPVAETEVPLRRGGALIGTVRLVQVGVGAGLPWSVTSVRGDALELGSPRDGQRVGSPLAARGSGDGPVLVRLLDDEGTELARSTAATTADGWEASLDWSDLRWSTGAVVASTPTGLALETVRRAGSPGPGLPPSASTFVAVDQGAVVLHDARTGARLRQLSYPGTAVDSSPSRGGDSAVFLRRVPGRCADVLVRVSLGNGAAGVTVTDTGVRREHPALSPDGRNLAWVERPCDAAGGEIVVRGPDARERRVPLVSERVDLSGVQDLGLRDDGALVVEKADGGVAVLGAGATSVDTAVSLGGGVGPCADTAVAWSGTDLYLWRGCAGRRVGLLLEGPGFGNGLQSPSDPVAAVLTTAVAQTETGPQVLAQLGGPDSPGPVVRVDDGRLVELYANQACATGAPGCLTDPAW